MSKIEAVNKVTADSELPNKSKPKKQVPYNQFSNPSWFKDYLTSNFNKDNANFTEGSFKG